MRSKNILIICISFCFLTISFYFISLSAVNLNQLQPTNEIPGYTLYLGDTQNEIWDKDRFVGFIPVDTCSALDRLMIQDNE